MWNQHVHVLFVRSQIEDCYICREDLVFSGPAVELSLPTKAGFLKPFFVTGQGDIF